MNLVIIAKNNIEGEVAKAKMSTRGDVRAYVCRNVREALNLSKSITIDCIMIDEGDAVCKHKLERSGYGGAVRTFSFPRPWTYPATRCAKIDYYVCRTAEKVISYWRSYGIRGLWRLPLHAMFLLGLHVVNVFKNLVVVDLVSGRIGHFCYNTHMFMQKQEWLDKARSIIGLVPFSSNEQLVKMYRRIFLGLIRNRRLVGFFNNPLMRMSKLWETSQQYRDIDEPWWMYPEERYLSFTEEEEVRGRSLMQQMGMKDDGWHICFHNRDAEYLAREHTYLTRAQWSYHAFRNSEIRNYLPAAEWIAQQGGWSLRMGAIVAEPLDETFRTERVVDYATNYRTDFGDIYLMAKAKFYLGTNCGLMSVATIFGVPVCAANFSHIEHIGCLRAGDLYIPKLVWHKTEERYLTLSEILAQGIGRVTRGEQLEQAGLEMRENSAQDILDFCIEMYQKLEGTWKPSPDDVKRLRRYKLIMSNPAYRCAGAQAQIGTTFLRKHTYLLA